MNLKVDQRCFLAMSLIILIGGIPGYFCQTSQLYMNCVLPYQCGNIRIGYPFYGADRPMSCGYPGFGLTCQGNDTLIKISDRSYHVFDINAQTNTLRLARDGYLVTLCASTFRTILNSKLFYFEWNITLYYNCSANQVQQISPSYRFNCSDSIIDNGTVSMNFYLPPKQASVVGDLSHSCIRTVNVPVDGRFAEDLEHPTNASTLKLQSALMTDFTVRWSSPDDDRCKNCIISGGNCGYNKWTLSFACYCADREHYSTCGYETPRSGRRIRPIWVLAVLIIAALLILLCCISLGCFRRKLKRRKDSQGTHQNLLLLDLNSNGNKDSLAGNSNGEGKSNNNDLPIFSFSSIAVATNNFSIANKLGEGGFGPVYKGELLNGQFVAVKRLSRRSGQGLEEFKTETELIAKLQHRNLVGILGCCIENEEKMLVYEYMPHKSLDSLLFDPNKKQLLDWRRRVQIIEGIAQGLLYLHHYSRFRIVHRDLKASNILLDNEMKPKISDFGMARIFGGNDLQANTNRIVGTYGYMSPEYAMEGLFSIKSDVYAFGVLMLEIISGKRNTGFHGHDCLSLLGYAWKLWENNSILDLVDPTLDVFSSSSSSRSSSSSASSSSSTPPRYIQIGLLCVQESAADRPVMSDVVAVLSNEQTMLASPKRPAFTVGRIVKASSGDKKVHICSATDLTISTMEAR